MSNLKRDIDQLVRKSLKDYAVWAKMALESELPYPSTVDDYNKALEGVANLTTTQIINLIESVTDKVLDKADERVNGALYIGLGREKTLADIKSKLIGEE